MLSSGPQRLQSRIASFNSAHAVFVPSTVSERNDAALRQTPLPPRFGWKFPTSGPGSDGSWQEWSLYGGTDKAPLPTVAGLPTILLDDEGGRPAPAVAVWDPLAAEYDPGAAPLADRHWT